MNLLYIIENAQLDSMNILRFFLIRRFFCIYVGQKYEKVYYILRFNI